jgi:predicted dehydrogenase
MLDAAIFGLGNWGQRLVGSIQGRSDKIRVIRGVVRSPEKARAFAAEHGFDVCADYDAVLRDRAVAAVIVATPHSLHHEHAIRAARAGKHVFVEKPFALTRTNAEAAARACEAAGVIMAVAQSRRFRPAFVKLKQLVDEGELGALLHIEGAFTGHYRHAGSSWRGSREENPAGGMAPRGIHVLDLMMDLFGEVESVQAFSDRRILEPGAMDDTTAMMLRFANGLTGYLCTMMHTSAFWRLHVFGSKGWAAMEGEHTLVIRREGAGEPEIRKYPEDDIFQSELECFADAVAGRDTFPVRPEQAVHGIAVIEAVAESARRDGVRIPVAQYTADLAAQPVLATHVQFGNGG